MKNIEHSNLKILEILKIEGVAGYSLVFFSMKFTVYGLLLMLPTYISKEL